MTVTRILIVDDVPTVREDLRTLLTLAGQIEVVGEATNGQEAVKRAQVLHPDAILMDLDMPILDGFEAARQIKQYCPTCRIIALTVHEYPAAREHAFQAGMDEFLVKGAPLADLIRAIGKE